MGSIAGILHNMRALAVQAANGTLLEADRQNIQVSVQGFIDEIDHIGSTTDFAGTRLLDGTYLNKGLHIGANYGENTLISIADARATYLGRYAVGHTERMSNEDLSGDLRINGIHVRATVDSDDQLSTTQRRASAISKAAAINDSFDRSNVNALINANEYAGLSDILGGTLDAANALFINEEAIGGYVITSDDADEQLMTAINLVSHRTGRNRISKREETAAARAEDGRNIHIKTTGRAGEITGLMNAAGDEILRSTLTLVSDDLFTVTDPTDGGAELKIGVDENEIIGRNQLDVLNTIDVSTVNGANRALMIIDRVQEAVIHSRGHMGGLENRLAFTLNRLNETAKQMYEARGKVQDADIAHESATIAKNNIVQTAFTNVLAQANKQSYQVLQLL